MRRRAALAIVAGTTLLAVGGAQATSAKRPSACPLPRGSEHVRVDPSAFTTRIDNPWWPMAPGSRWTYRETDPEGPTLRGVVTVTRKTRRIADGVTARVVSDVARRGRRPVEVTDDYYAQDRCGNIWYFGEATTEYANGKPKSTEGSFEAGVDGAQPGVIVPAEPRPGTSYRQEYYAGHAEDAGQVFSLTEQVESPYGHFGRGRVLMTRDLNPLEPDTLEYKFYARGVGQVLAIAVSGGSDREELVGYHRGG
jgi:hypothetical protein